MKSADDNPYDQLDGLTRLVCCSGCGLERCVISGIGVCAHPARSGLQSAMSRDPDVVKRYELARRLLALQAAEAKEAKTL
jgi:hypothetical protein